MRHLARPSDVYRLPHPTPPRDDQEQPEQDEEPAETRAPRAAAVAVALVAAFLLGGLGLAGSDSRPAGGIDAVSEDETLAVLSLFASEAGVLERLVAQPDPFAPPGIGAAAGAVEHETAMLNDALANARKAAQTDGARAYVSAADHDRLLDRLRAAARLGREIEFLSAVHDTLYAGAGALSLRDAEQQLTSLFVTGRAPRALARWAGALLAQLDGVDSALAAQAARADTARLWIEGARSLQHAPAAGLLAAYVRALPPGMLHDLRGHPVARAALARLPAAF